MLTTSPFLHVDTFEGYDLRASTLSIKIVLSIEHVIRFSSKGLFCCISFYTLSVLIPKLISSKQSSIRPVRPSDLISFVLERYLEIVSDVKGCIYRKRGSMYYIGCIFDSTSDS